MASTKRQLRSGSLPSQHTANISKAEKAVIFRPFTLFSLPAELRVTIYELLFANHRFTWRWGLGPDGWRFSDKHRRRFSILCTSKKAHEEANHVLYRMLKFTCYVDHEERKVSTGMLDAVPPTIRLDLITCLHVDIALNWEASEHVAAEHGQAFLSWSALSRFTGLNLLQIQLLDEGYSGLELDKWNAEQRTWNEYPLVLKFVKSLVRAVPLSVHIIAQDDAPYRDIQFPKDCYLATDVMRKFLQELDFSERGKAAPLSDDGSRKESDASSGTETSFHQQPGKAVSPVQTARSAFCYSLTRMTWAS